MPDVKDTQQLIAEGNQFALYSLDGGAICTLRCKEESTTARIEGEEVAAFLAEYENVKAQYPGYDNDQVLAQLWDQGGYSWMATPDEE